MKAFLAYETDFAYKNISLEYLNEAMEKDPNEPIYHRMAAVLNIHLGNYPDAVKILNDSLKLTQSPNEIALLYLHMGWAYDLAGDHNKAITHYKEVFSLRNKKESDSLISINDFVYLKARQCVEHPFTPKDINENIPIGFNLETGFE